MSSSLMTAIPTPAGADEPDIYVGAATLPADAVADEVRDLVDGWLAEHPGGGERLIPLLHRVQQELGHLPFPVQEYVAESLDLSPVQVYGVVSFYHFFTTVPRGRYQLKVCTGTACFVRRSQRLLDALHDTLHLEVGGLTEDRLFSLEEVRCLGACGLAPAMMVNSEVHGNLTPERLRNLVRGLAELAGASAEEDARE